MDPHWRQDVFYPDLLHLTKALLPQDECSRLDLCALREMEGFPITSATYGSMQPGETLKIVACLLFLCVKPALLFVCS